MYSGVLAELTILESRAMAESRKIVKAFLASPSDLADERRAAKAVVDEFNALFSGEFGYQVELVGWEDTVSVYGRPQATINRELERCELFVGMMWKRWGTPPGTSGSFTSGFEEEFHLSVSRRRKDGRPEISLFFKDVTPEFLIDPGPDLKKVLAFREQLVTDKTVLFETFSDPRDLEKKLRRCITRYVLALRSLEADIVTGLNQAPTQGGERQQGADTRNAKSESSLSIQGAVFLREFVEKTERPATDEHTISAVDVARFRLLARAVGKQGNDGYALGVHDANLLFAQGRNFDFGYVELAGLVESGLEHFSDENTPLWRWYQAIDGFSRELLSTYSIMGSEAARRAGALSAMKLIAEPLPRTDRDLYVRRWFATETATRVKLAAIAYLVDCGNSDDLQALRQEFDRNDYQTRNAAAEAIVRINLRDSRERAIAALYELQPAYIAPKVVGSLFEKASALSTDVLLNGVAHQSSAVRRVVVALLRTRRELPREVAEQLLADTDAWVRYEALNSLIDAGQVFSDAQAKSILVKPSQQGTFSFLMSNVDLDGDASWERFQQQRLNALKDAELEAALAEDSIFTRNAHFVLAERHFDAHGNELRQAVDDQYKATFANWVQEMTARFGGAEFINKTRSVEESVRKDLARRALDIICRRSAPDDLRRVRDALKSGFVDYSSTDIEYLRRHGEWEDVQLIIETIKRPDAGSMTSLLGSENDAKYPAAARAILKLGRNRLSEIVTIDAPSRLLCHIIAAAPNKEFRALSNDVVKRLFNSENDSVRKASAVKAVRSFSKSRLSKMLDMYVSLDQYRYYNVVHWLDFGASVPRNVASAGADKVLTTNWPT